jgi:glycosyltransferase involved in cell wall biosynthesis
MNENNMNENNMNENENKLFFSIGLIIKNESLRLPILYENLKNFMNDGGEVVILDTGSDDDSVKIAKSYGFKVYISNKQFNEYLSNKDVKKVINEYIEPQDVSKFNELIVSNKYFNFGKARNELHNYVSNDILIQIDGSDTLSHFDYHYINNQIKSNNINRFEYTQIYSSVELTISRFYNKNIDTWQDRIHEILTHNNSNKTLKLPKHILTIVHNYQPKTRNYLSGLFANLLEKPTHTRTLYYLGRELMFSSLYLSSIKMLNKYVERPDCWIPERSSAYCLIGNCYENLSPNKEYFNHAFKAYNDAFIAFNGWREPLLKMARLTQRTDEFQRGLCYSMAALSINRVSAFAEPMQNYLGLPHEIAYWGFHFTGRNREACSHWKVAITLEPNHQKYNNDSRFFNKPELFDQNILNMYLI